MSGRRVISSSFSYQSQMEARHTEGARMEEGCRSCHKWEDHYYWNHLDARRIHFLNYMTGDFSRCMSLPKRFVKNFKGDLSKIVNLKGPSGKSWHVELTRASDNMFLQSGWSDFVKDHHIEEGNILVFKYAGNSCFEVLIFEGHGCEKTSALFAGNHDPRIQERRGDNVEIVNRLSSSKGIECISLSSSCDDSGLAPCGSIEASTRIQTRLRSDKRTRLDEHFIYPNAMCYTTRNTHGTSKGAKCHIQSGSVEMHDEKNAPENIFIINKSRLTDTQKMKAMQFAHSIQSENPCCITVLQPELFGKRTFLTIPRAFVMATNLPRETRSIFLQTLGKKKKWPVTYSANNRTSTLLGGLKIFLLENNLKEGDVCHFELKRSKEIIMLVRFSRAEEMACSSFEQKVNH